MPEMRCNDPAIRLFGQKIPLPAGSGSPATDDAKDSPTREVTEATQDDDSLPPYETTPDCNENPKTRPIDEDSSKSRSSKVENEQSDAGNSHEKPLKKPDKILPCPRCNSTHTKFCYYNNYNVSQPRHFCKSCQRYWTAGGTMRNVPVGAGRRKNKNPASHYRHITISEALQAAHIDNAPDRTSHPALNANGRVLSFGLEPSVCNPVASMLNLPDTKTLNGARNGFYRIKVAENVDDRSSLATGHSSLEEGLNHPQEHLARGINGYAPSITCLPGVPWPYPTAFCPPGYPMPFFPPAAYWNCEIPGGWNIPMLSPQSSTSSNQKKQCPNPNSSNLGKHSRDKDELNPVESEKGSAPKHKNGRVLVPKILRIDDPDEAAKSSIWTALGIKNESFSRGGFFKAIQPKGDEKNRPAEASCAMRANPAALSRSIGFHESS